MTQDLIPRTELTKNAESDFSSEGNLPVEDSRLMSIDMSNAAFIMDALTNLYSDPKTAVMREYIANAIDSHVDAGVTDPVEVTLPSNWSSVLEIKDHGVGMSLDDVFSYGQYGTSDKRENLDLVGNFGMGSKSALTITNSFTVTAVKNGEKTIASIGRNDDGAGQIDIIFNGPTDERNGVTISIPVSPRDIYQFSHRLDSVIEYLPAGTVSVDGTINSDPFEDKTELGENVYYSSLGNINHWRGYDATVIVGGFGYSVPKETLSNIRDNDLKFVEGGFAPRDLYLVLPLGSVDLTPSRESLRMTARTTSIIRQSIINSMKKFTEDLSEAKSNIKNFEDVSNLLSSYFRSTSDFGFALQGVDSVTYSSDVTYFSLVCESGSSNIYKDTDATYKILDAMCRGNKIIVVNNDKNYSVRYVKGKVQTVIEADKDTYPDGTILVLPSDKFVDDLTDTKDNLVRYVLRTRDRVDLSSIYAEAAKIKRKLSPKVASNRTSRENAILDYDLWDGDYVNSYSVRGGDLKDLVEEEDESYESTVVIFNGTASSGHSVNTQEIRYFESFASHLSIAGFPRRVIILQPRNRTIQYYKALGVSPITVSEYYESISEVLDTEEAVNFFKKVKTYLVARSRIIIDNALGFNDMVSSTNTDVENKMSRISQELNIVIPEEGREFVSYAAHILPTMSEYFKSRTPTLNGRRAEYNVPDDYSWGRTYKGQLSARDRAITDVLDAAVTLHKGRHYTEVCAMLDVVLNLIKKDK